jgi:hypothetical protein
MKALALFWVALLFPMLCLGQPSPPVISVDIVSGSERSRAFETMQQQADERAKKKQAYTLRVRYVKVEGRWAGQVQIPLLVGDVLTPEKVSQAMEAIEGAITRNYIQGYGLRSKGEVGVLYIDVDFDTDQPSASVADADTAKNTVGVIFHPYYVHISLVQLGNNVLPIPRSELPTFYGNVPKPLLILKPTFGVSYDRAFGTGLGATFETDLLNLSDPGRISSSSNETNHLYIHGQGIKSVEEVFYRADVGFHYSVQRSGTVLQQFSVLGDYYGVKEPLGDAEHARHAGVANGGMTFKLAPNMQLVLNAGYRWTDDRMNYKLNNLDTHTSANEQSNRVLFDWIPRLLYGFLRAAVWEDNAWLTGVGGSYQRLAGRLGYAKEIPLAPNQTIGLELLAGGGRVWGDAPAYAHFFGGNSPGQFLYDSPSSETLLNMPPGPLIRSFGEGRAGFRTLGGGLRGGNAFWHVNLNLTLPIPPLSRALIPDELTDIEDANGNPISLKQLLRKQIDVTGTNMLMGALRKEGMSPEEAEKKAVEILDEVRPATHFIIDQANLFSIKPLLMFDAAGMTGHGGRSPNTWLAAGGGVQVTIVIAKFEFGYMYTLSGPTSGNRGNVFGRLVFQNLF